MKQTDPQIKVRLPVVVRDRVQASAQRNQRSMTAEIAARLASDNDLTALLDHFAGQALAGLCANPGGPFQACEQSGWTMANCTIDQVAQIAYELAAAMLNARAAS